jgi:hypothetical protein
VVELGPRGLKGDKGDKGDPGDGGPGGGITQDQADARYIRQSTIDAANGTPALDGAIKLKLAQLPAHAHVLADITGLVSALAGKEATGVAASTMATHVAAVDPHPQYTTAAELATAIAGKADTQSLADVAFTGLKADVGLGNVDNTADSAKPVSVAAQAALDGKQPLDSDLTAIAALASANDSVMQRKAGAWTGRTPAQLKTDLVLTKTDVGLGNVDNTADSAKPVSTATQTALDGKQPLDSDLTALAALAPADDTLVQRKAGAWVARTPAQVKTDLVLVKGDVGLGSVDNTSDTGKPVSTAQAAAIAAAVAGLATTGYVDAGDTATLAAAITKALIDAKGDLLAGTADNTVARVAVGSNGQYLVADSGATPGLKWTDGVAALTDGATIATDASAGELFTVTLAGNRTLGAPTNARGGMKRTWSFTQDGTGSRTITLATGAGGFALGSQIPDTNLLATAGKTGYLTAIYNAGADRWHVLAFEPGA